MCWCFYAATPATSSPNDPAGAISMNTMSQTIPGMCKGNFWADSGVVLPLGSPNFAATYSLGGVTYAPLYPKCRTGWNHPWTSPRCVSTLVIYSIVQVH